MPKPASSSPGAIPDAHRWVRVWDPFVRLFHWSLVASFVVAWLSRHNAEAIHYWAGFAAAGLVALRVIWGLIGTRYARFTQFIHGPRAVLAYLRAIAAGNEPRFVGHNPAGGAMIIALLAGMAGTAVTGWMMTTDAFWGVAWVGRLHELCADALLLLVLMHIGGVVLASFRHRESLIGAMIFGRKRAPEADDIS